MSLRSVVMLNLGPMMRRRGRTALAVVVVASGTALLSGVVTAQHSVTASLRSVSQSLAGPAPLRVIGPSSHGGLDESVLPLLRATPGVRAVVPVVQAIVQAEGSRQRTQLVIALGVDCSAEALVGRFGCDEASLASTAPGTAPATSPDLLARLGPGGAVRTDLALIRLDPQRALTPLNKINDGRVVVFPLKQAQAEFVRPGTVDAAYVVPIPGTDLHLLRDRLAQALPEQDTVLTAGQASPFFDSTGLLLPLMGLIALMSLGVASLIIFNIVSLTAAERRRELAIAHAIGASGGVVARGAFVEAGLMGLIGGCAGAAAGLVVAAPLVGRLGQQVALFTGVHLHVHADLAVFVAAPLVGLLTAVAAAVIPVRRALRLDVARELHARTALDLPSAGRSLIVAVVMMGLGGVGLGACLLSSRNYAIESWQPLVGSIGLLVTMVTFIGATVVVAPALLRLTQPWARRQRGVVGVAVRVLAAQPRRTGIAATAVTVSVAFASILAAAIPAIDNSTVQLFDRVIGSRVYVSPLGYNNTSSVDSKAGPGVVTALRRLPDVAAVEPTYFLSAPVDGRRVAISSAVDDPLPFHVIDGTAARRALAGGEVLVGPSIARADHVRAGSTVTVDGTHGRVQLTVAGVWADPDNVGQGLTMAPHLMTQLFGPQPPLGLIVRPRAGVSVDRLADEIRAASPDPRLIVLAPHGFLLSLEHDVQSLLSPFWTLQDALLVVALLGTLSTLLLAGAQRRQEFGTLAALGLSPPGLARLTLIEAGIVGLLGSALGIVAGLVNGFAMMSVSVFVAGATPPFGFAYAATARYIALALGVVIIGAAWPAWRTARIEVVQALRAE